MKENKDMDKDKILLSSNIEVNIDAIHFNFKRIINQVYKLLPMREEGRDW